MAHGVPLSNADMALQLIRHRTIHSGLTFSMASWDTFGAPGNVTRTALMLSLLFCGGKFQKKGLLMTGGL